MKIFEKIKISYPTDAYKMMEHTIHTLVMSFINEQKNYHAIHGVWEDDVNDGWELIISFLRRTIDENTAINLVEERNDPDTNTDDAYENLAFLVATEDEMDDMNYKN